ncbi:MAG: hypothetical protein EHM58_01290 [Ignavibacteriae bacterium]|nr:MAG: hypothetical protein EHM58_01290 [Ignavibacteriota bacterium]
MNSRKQLLNHLLDIGGVGTLNNFYSPFAKTHKGGLLFTRKLFKSYAEDGLIEKIETIGKPANKAHEVFYCLTKKGADYIGRPNEYRYKKYQRSPYNIMHESMKFDVALSFLRLFPHKKFTFRYDASFYGVRPDILIRVESSNPKELTRFLLVEIERKKTIDRVFHEKIKRYEEMFQAITQKKSHNVSQFQVLVVYTDIWWDVFLRPQEYNNPSVINHIDCITGLLKNLVNHYCKFLPPDRYRFLGFHNFYRLPDVVWHTPQGNRVALLL